MEAAIFNQYIIPYHIAIASASIVIGTVAIFAPKKRPVHRLFGRLFVWVTMISVATGVMLLVDPGIKIYLLSTGKIWKDFLAAIFQSALYLELLFVYFSYIIFYQTITGQRVWKRMAHPKDGRIMSGPFDWVLTALLFPLIALALFVGIEDLLTVQNYGYHLLGFTALFVTMAAIDVWTYIARPRVDSGYWWLLHMYKMLSAYAAIVYAVFLRHYAFFPKEFQISGFGAIFLLVLLIPSFLYYWPKFRKSNNRRQSL